MIEVRSPVNQFFDSDGTPLDAGYIYIGTTGANPETTPQTVYWDKAGTIPAAQPLRTLNGYPARDGAVSKFYTATKNYSITVKDKRGILVIGLLNSDSGIFDELSEDGGAAAVGYENATSGLVATDVQAAIDEVQENVNDVLAVQSTQSGLVNLFMNSAFIHNQRSYVSGAATSGANQYTIDRIRVVVSGENLAFTAAAFGNRITAPAGGAEQVVEGIFIVGGDYVCTWTGTGSIQVNGVAKAKNETFTLTAGANATVRMFGEFETFAFTRPDMAGRYEYNFQADFNGCCRYAYQFGASRPKGQASSAATVTSIEVYTPAPMRTTPAISVGSHNFTNSAGAQVGPFTVVATSVSGSSVRLDASGGSGLAAGNITVMVPAAGTFLSAEL